MGLFSRLFGRKKSTPPRPSSVDDAVANVGQALRAEMDKAGRAGAKKKLMVILQPEIRFLLVIGEFHRPERADVMKIINDVFAMGNIPSDVELDITTTMTPDESISNRNRSPFTGNDHTTIACALALEEDFGGWVPPPIADRLAA